MPKASTPTDKVLHPKVRVEYHFAEKEGGQGPLTCTEAKKYLGWEAEGEYVARRRKEDSSLSEKECLYGDVYLLKDHYGNKIRCWRNDQWNRPFDPAWALSLQQDILTKCFSLNCENIIISRTGRVESGVHRLVGLVLSGQRWQIDGTSGYYRKFWKSEPTIDTLICFGASEDPRVIRTLDNTKTRTQADMIYTSPDFADLAPIDRKECSSLLAGALDLVWLRTNAAEDEHHRYQTHSESSNFRERHPRLLKCVKSIFKLNQNRALARLKLSAGRCAGLFYLMGCSTSNVNEYRLGNPPRAEQHLKWERWERAEQFWEMVTTSSDDEAGRLREALASIRTEEEEGAVKFPPPSAREKMAVLVRAWNEFVRGKILTKRALDLSDIRTLDENGHPVLTQCPVVGGIDQGDRIKAQRRDGILVMTEEEMETKRTAAREARGRQMDASVRRT